MRLPTAVLSCALVLLIALRLNAQQSLPPLHNGVTVAGPGIFTQDRPLRIEGRVVLKDLTLNVRAPIVIAEKADLTLQNVNLIVSDPPGATNGASNLHCEGPASIHIHNSTMKPEGSAHPIWMLKGALDVDGFQTVNSEFHLRNVQAKLRGLKIFELEISDGTQVTADDLDLVFLSTHTGENENLSFSDIPTERSFSRVLHMGSGARANLRNTKVQIFLLYLQGASRVDLARLDRVQIGLFPSCNGKFELRTGRQGSGDHPSVIPVSGTSDCPFHLTLNDVNVDTWDVYAKGHSDLQFDNSVIDELNVNENASVQVRNSQLYADWMAVTGDASARVENSTVGALRLAEQRPDLATSEARVIGRGHAVFDNVRFDCGLVAEQNSTVEINTPSVPPKYIKASGDASVRIDGKPVGK